MKNLSKLTLALFCAMLLVSISDAQAQKKPKPKGLAKEIVGSWTLDDLEVKLDESKADSMQKAQFSMMLMMMNAAKKEMKGKINFDFKTDGTYLNKSERNGETIERNGTWTMEGNKLKLKPNVPEENTPEYLLVSVVNKKLNLEAPPQAQSPIPATTILKLVKK